ncbi:hypothetical protein SEA_AMGINE_3 [Mycobacterium phage Amgine]|uniref:Uncharacterized protein n=1 Tax=Mycobacterium phage Amgine TaxID=2015817 RepID=A0A222ZLH1_9CAUD|nr:hypothetical protein I5G84_gp03 [Mycobacterium phage Amgine]ASR85604.1 hypothetical protein SEA_AMGINE_3 [Mycobacterium phage Amgine]
MILRLVLLGIEFVRVEVFGLAVVDDDQAPDDDGTLAWH